MLMTQGPDAPDHGPIEQARFNVLADVAVGSRGSLKRAMRADNLLGLSLDGAQLQALIAWRQAVQQCWAGKSMGPLPWAKDASNLVSGEPLPEQMRAMSSATWMRRGIQAAGQKAWPVLYWVVVSGGATEDYDANQRRRKGWTKAILVQAAEAIAVEYGFANSRLLTDAGGEC